MPAFPSPLVTSPSFATSSVGRFMQYLDLSAICHLPYSDIHNLAIINNHISSKIWVSNITLKKIQPNFNEITSSSNFRGLLLFKRRSYYIAQVYLKLIMIFLPQSLECWDYRHEPPHLVLAIL
jgi:hypothetical protein